MRDHSSRTTCGSFALVAWYKPVQGQTEPPDENWQFHDDNWDLVARPIERQRTKKFSAGAKIGLWHLHQNRFRPNCDSPVGASQGQPFAMLVPPNLERQAQSLATTGHFQHFQRSSRAVKGPIASISTISSSLFSWQVSHRH